MSSWLGDWERKLIPKKDRGKKERTQCKVGRHVVLDGEDAIWLMSPMGLSCVPCAERVDPAAVAAERERLAGPKKAAPAVPAQRQPAAARQPRQKRLSPEDWVHGKRSTYTFHGCRCEVCRAANAKRSARYRANKAAGAVGVAG